MKSFSFVDSDRRPIGEMIAYYRLVHGLTQTELSREIGISSVSLSSIEQGKSFPGDAVAEKLYTWAMRIRGA